MLIAMTENIEIKGYWFLPSEPDNRVAGTLYFSPNRKLTLELIGSFRDPVSYIKAVAERVPKKQEIILGESSDGKEITLINCDSYGSLNFSSTFPLQNFNVQYCMQGIHLTNRNDEIFDNITVKIPYLTKWVNHYDIKYAVPFKDNRANGFSLSFDRDNSNLISVQLDDEYELELEFTCSPPGTHYEEQLIIRQAYQLNIISKNLRSFWSLLSQTGKFKMFLTLGTLNTVGYQSISFHSPHKFQELNNGERIFHPINLYFNQIEEWRPNVSAREFLFTHDLINQSFDAVIKKWFSFDVLMAPILKHLIESIKEKNIFNTGDFLIVIQALEGYATRFRPNIPKKEKRIKLIEQLNYLHNEFSYLEIIKNTPLDLEVAVNSRHYYSHFFAKKQHAHVAEGVELYEITQGLKTKLICCVLNEAGFDQFAITSIMKAYRQRR